MKKFLVVSGSPRKGNTEYILEKILQGIDGEKEIIYLKNLHINHCMGCLSCDVTNECVQKDSMTDVRKKMEWADCYIFGTPTYFNNVSGLFKDFMDRTLPFYKTGKLKNKKVINIIAGGEPAEESELIVESLKYFLDSYEIEDIHNYYFQALKLGEVENNPDNDKIIADIISVANSVA